jgi:hypothetical protein
MLPLPGPRASLRFSDKLVCVMVVPTPLVTAPRPVAERRSDGIDVLITVGLFVDAILLLLLLDQR